jgi:hypothetical protein
VSASGASGGSGGSGASGGSGGSGGMVLTAAAPENPCYALRPHADH